MIVADNYFDGFSGIGGFPIGLYNAGMRFKHHLYSELDDFCIQLYGKRFPDAIALGSITTIDWYELKKKYPGSWFFTGGFPCQDISVAGKGIGINGARSGLWFEMQKAISILRPCFVIIENVSVLAIRGLDRVLSSLAEIGYDAEWQLIRASDVGAPHKRARIWIVAYPSVNTDTESQYCNGSNNYKRGGSFEQAISKFRNGSWQSTSSDANNAKTTRQRNDRGQILSVAKSKGLDNCDRFTADTTGTRCPHINSDEARTRWNTTQSAWRTNWIDVATRLCNVDDGLPRRVDQLRGGGNAIVPQIAELIALQILNTYDVRAEN